jgi:hypothetical protein
LEFTLPEFPDIYLIHLQQPITLSLLAAELELTAQILAEAEAQVD